MACRAVTRNDGSWHCAVCGIGGDHGEDPEDYCPKRLNTVKQLIRERPSRGKKDRRPAQGR